MPNWDDAQYLKFGDERTRAARELLARVPIGHAGFVLDLGCGPGNSTALLHARWPGARVVGVDDSKQMLQRARTDLPQLEWIEADAARFAPATPADLIFANALLHWLPDHASLVPRLFTLLAAGGVLALQMPRNFNEPSHRLMRDIAGPWKARIEALRPHDTVGSPSFYYDLLAPLAQSVDIWQTTYEMVMPDAASIVEWVRGTGLRPYLDALDRAESAAYLEAYERAIDGAYAPRADGRRLFSFPRLFVVAARR